MAEAWQHWRLATLRHIRINCHGKQIFRVGAIYFQVPVNKFPLELAQCLVKFANLAATPAPNFHVNHLRMSGSDGF
jgi:hypothetical protein